MVASPTLPEWGPGLQPRHVPWLAIQPATLRFTGLGSTHWDTPHRAIHKEIFKNTYFLLERGQGKERGLETWCQRETSISSCSYTWGGNEPHRNPGRCPHRNRTWRTFHFAGGGLTNSHIGQGYIQRNVFKNVCYLEERTLLRKETGRSLTCPLFCPFKSRISLSSSLGATIARWGKGAIASSALRTSAKLGFSLCVGKACPTPELNRWR